MSGMGVRSMGILPMSITGVSPVENDNGNGTGPGRPCDSWARCPCHSRTAVRTYRTVNTAGVATALTSGW